MTNLTTPNKISVATVTDKTHPTKVKTDAPDGMSFGALLAQQVIDNAPSPETTPPMLAEGKDVLLATSSKSQDEKKPVTKNVSADLPANVIALLPPLQDIPLPATTETANGSKIAKTNLPNTLVRDIPAKAIDAPATKGLPGNAESDVIAAAPSNQASDLKKVPADSVNLAERLSSPESNPGIPAQSFAVAPTANLPTLPAASSLSTQPPPLSTPLGKEGWANEFSQSIRWMTTKQQDQIAELHLNPPDLGPLSVMLKISDNQATAVFTSPHSAVREAVENAMPKLREILADNGIALGNTTVSDQPQRDGNANAFSNQHSRQQNGHWSAQTTGHSTISALPIMQVNTLQKHNGMVDTFA